MNHKQEQQSFTLHHGVNKVYKELHYLYLYLEIEDMDGTPSGDSPNLQVMAQST